MDKKAILKKYSMHPLFEGISILEFNFNEGKGDGVIHLAVILGNVQDVGFILKNIKDVNIRGDIGHTALHYAVLTENKEVIDILISSGADVHAQNDYGDTPLHYAEDLGNDCLEFILSKSDLSKS